MDDFDISLFLIHNKEEILKAIKLQNFDDKKVLFYDFSDDYSAARRRYIVRETIMFFVEKMDMDYENLQNVIDYPFLARLWTLDD